MDAADAPSWREVSDIPEARVSEVREWYRMYKTAEGKGENTFALGGAAVGAAKAREIATHTHARWRALALERTAACEFDGAPCWVDHEPRGWAAPPACAAGGDGACAARGEL